MEGTTVRSGPQPYQPHEAKATKILLDNGFWWRSQSKCRVSDMRDRAWYIFNGIIGLALPQGCHSAVGATNQPGANYSFYPCHCKKQKGPNAAQLP